MFRQSAKQKQAKVRHVKYISKFKLSKGTKPRLTPKGIGKLKTLIKKQITRKLPGKPTGRRSIEIKIRYKNEKGKMRSRFESKAVHSEEALLGFLEDYAHGITYQQYFVIPGSRGPKGQTLYELNEDGTPRMVTHHLTDRGSIEQIEYEQIQEEPEE